MVEFKLKKLASVLEKAYIYTNVIALAVNIYFIIVPDTRRTSDSLTPVGVSCRRSRWNGVLAWRGFSSRWSPKFFVSNWCFRQSIIHIHIMRNTRISINMSSITIGITTDVKCQVINKFSENQPSQVCGFNQGGYSVKYGHLDAVHVPD